MVNNLSKKIAQDKLIILYIIDKAKNISLNQLTNFILEFDIINYFDFITYQKELVEGNMIGVSDENFVTLTDLSHQILNVMEDSIDLEVKSLIDDAFNGSVISDSSREYIVTPTKDDQYMVKLTIKDLDENFSLSFTVPSKDEADKIKTLWENKNRSLYNEIVNKTIKDAIK